MDAEPILKSSDMPEDLKSETFAIAQKAAKENQKTVDIAASIKKQLDAKYGPTFHVVVGKSFGSFVSHEAGSFAYFYIGNLAFLVFKTA